VSILLEPELAPVETAPSFWRFLRMGWAPIVIGAMAMAATFPGRTYGLGTVTEPLLRDLGMADADGRVLYSSLNFWGTMIGALFCLPVGWLFDRYDRRWILAGNLVLLGASVWWMSRYVESWQQLFVGLILTRGFGQSALSVVSMTVVAKSFNPKQLGLATALYAMAGAPFHLIFIKGVGWALGDGGFTWREVWGGVGWGLVALSVTSLALPRNPSPPSNDPTAPDAPLTGSTFWQALATPAFWVFALTMSIWGMIFAGVALFNEDIFNKQGFDKSLYFNVLAMTTVLTLAANLFFGWLVNYVGLNRLLGVCLLITALSLFGLPFATQPWHAYLYGVVWGIASGAVSLVWFASWGKLFGARALGRIQGVAQMLTVFASAAGPFVFSYSKRATESYSLIFEVLAAVVFLMGVAAWFTPLPRFARETS
jgi:MFS family permease